MATIKRNRYLVNKPGQLRYLGLVLIPLVIFLAGLYYLIYYSVLNQILIPEAIATTLVPAIKKVNMKLAIAGPIFLALIIRTSLIYSNRLIGPLPRLERELDRVLAGDLSVRIQTRPKDDLSALVHKINLLLEKIDRVKSNNPA